ncbi:MAG: prepilin peptidase [bacterium]
MPFVTKFQTAIIFLLGTILGSFLNVCIYRLPRKLSILRPGSHCPRCKTAFPLWFNIPLLSYVLLRGKCRYCKRPISIRYPLVEFLTGALLALVFNIYGLGLAFIEYSVLILFLVPISFIDIDYKLILNRLTFPGMAIGLALSVLFHRTSIYQALAGLFLGGGFLWLVGLLGHALFKKESMGGGDIKLAAMIGAFLGPQVILALFLAFFLTIPAIIIGMSLGRIQMGSALPFGPFISSGAVSMVCFGHQLIRLYSNYLIR